MNNIEAVHRLGQAIWLDYIQRDLITSGELKRLVEDGLRGLTSNPTIFEKAVSESTAYDGLIREMLQAEPEAGATAVYERLTVEDIRMAADVLRTVYDASAGDDGYVSLEVSPHLAHDTRASVAEAKRLWREVGHPNLMIKIPATREGIPAIETLISEGINVNATLMFSLDHYEAVAGAYVRGIERSAHPRQVSSVASFFVSRIDTMVDRALEAIGSTEALGLRGRTAIANAKITYARFRDIFHGEAFARLAQRGARVQRPLWGSTSTKNPAYSDVLYVEGLIGEDTVNTVPPATLSAFQDHGQVQPSLLQGWDEARNHLARLAELGVDLAAVTEQLQVDGVAAFAASYDKLLAALDRKRRGISARRAGL